MDPRGQRLWQLRFSQLADPAVEAVLTVQFDLEWLRPELLALRNTADQRLLELQSARPEVDITRLILHSLPAPAPGTRQDAVLAGAFAEWNGRLGLSQVLLNRTDLRPTVIRRVIIPGRPAAMPLPDTIQIRRRGRWTGQSLALRALDLAERPGSTTLQVDVDLAVPYLDDDPSSLL
jgi:hypothetical protein